jgi:hypothetical protein
MVDDEREAIRFCQLLDMLGLASALKALDDADQKVDAPTMDELAADHITHLTGVEDGTRLKYTRIWDGTWSPLLGKLPADLPDLRDKIALATNELAKRYSYKSLKNQRGLLHGVCERGMEKATSSATRRISSGSPAASPRQLTRPRTTTTCDSSSRQSCRSSSTR